MFLVSLFLVSWTLCSIVESDDKTYGDAVVKVISIYDGDTFFVDICNWPDIIGKRVGVRINGIDTPEIRTKNNYEKMLARAAKEAVAEKLRNADKVELKNIKRGKYFRIVADVIVDGDDLGSFLLSRRLAKPYDGDAKPKWSEKDYNDYLKTRIFEYFDSLKEN